MPARRIILICILAVFVVAAPTLAQSDIPRKINYQGLLTDIETGQPLVGSYSLTFSLYNQLTGGSLLWSETKTVVADTAGVFSTILGSVTPIDISFEDAGWLEIAVEGEILSPRRELASVPYAFRALNALTASSADSLGGFSSASYALAGHLHDDVYVNEGQAGSVTVEMIVDGAGSGLDADLLDGQHATAFSTAAHAHDERYYTEAELNTTGTINQTSNPVDWTKLKGVPAGFADGTDNVGAGDGYSLDAADGSPTDVVYVDNAGNVGINVTNPTLGKLQVLTTAGTAICGTSNSGAGIYGFSDTGNGLLGASNTGKAGAFSGEVYVSGRVDSDSGYSIRGQTLLSAPPEENLFVGRGVRELKWGAMRSTCVGDSTGSYWLGADNVFLGYNAGCSRPVGYGSPQPLTSVTNKENVFVGAYAGYANGSAKNVYVGYEAGRNASSGMGNTFVGTYAGRESDDGGDNVFIGAGAGLSNTTGNANVCCGTYAGSSRETAYENTYIGRSAGGSQTVGFGETGEYNVAVGSKAGFEADGDGNVFLGYEAGYRCQASNRLYVANGRYDADVLVYGDFATGNIGLGTLSPERKLHILGDGPRLLIESTGGNPEINIENTDDTSVERWALYKHSIDDDLRFYQNGDRVTFESGTGNVAIGATDAAGYRLCVNGSVYAASGYYPSDSRLKTDFQSVDDALGKIVRLNGVSFRWRTEEYADRGFPDGRHYGLVAQELEEVLPEVVGRGLGEEKAIAYSELIPVLVEAVKQLSAENDALRARLDALEKR